MGAAIDVFDAANASAMSGTRNKLEYVDVDQSAEVSEDDARWAAQLAERAVVEVTTFLS
jgi:hypothetical protein